MQISADFRLLYDPALYANTKTAPPAILIVPSHKAARRAGPARAFVTRRVPERRRHHELGGRGRGR